MAAPWLGPQRNGGNPLTLVWGTARSQGTPPTGDRPAGALASPGVRGGRRSGTLFSNGPEGLWCHLQQGHTRVCVHTQVLPGGCGQTVTLGQPPPLGPHSPRAHRPRQLCSSAPSGSQSSHTCARAHTHTHTPSTHGGHPSSEGSAWSPGSRSWKSRLQPLSSQEGRPGAPHARHAQQVLRAGVRMRRGTLAAVWWWA